MSWKLLKAVALGLVLLGSPVRAQGPVGAVMLVDVPDVSGSMAKTVTSMTVAEVAQLKRTLRPGDVYARVPFDAEAKLTVLQHVRAAEDVDNISAVVSERTAAGGKTSISKGLIAARDVVERAAGNRRVVLVLASDGENDPTDGKAAEQQRLEAVAAWWKARPATDRIIVGIIKAGKRPRLEALAASLGARLVTLEDYKGSPIVERAISEARSASSPPLGPPPPKPAAPHVAPMPWRPWTLAALSFVAIGWFALKKTNVEVRRRVLGAPAMVTVPKTPASELFVSVTANGQAQHTLLPVDELELGTATLGTSGTVTVPGLSGAPVTVFVAADGLTLSEEAGTGVRVNGDPLGLMPQPAHVGRECRLTHRGVAVTLQLRRAGERCAAHPIRLVANGRRR